jgi:alpha-L-rhamnosidase
MLFVSFLGGVICVIADDVSIGNLRVEYAVNPLGVDVLNPRFSWEFTSTSAVRNITQSSFEIIVTKNEFGKSGSVVWDFSGKSNNSMGIEYNGTKLEKETRYSWKVICTTSNNAKISSKETWFETGLLSGKIWGWDGAEWLTKTATTIADYTITYDFKIISEAVVFVSVIIAGITCYGR